MVHKLLLIVVMKKRSLILLLCLSSVVPTFPSTAENDTNDTDDKLLEWALTDLTVLTAGASLFVLSDAVEAKIGKGVFSRFCKGTSLMTIGTAFIMTFILLPSSRNETFKEPTFSEEILLKLFGHVKERKSAFDYSPTNPYLKLDYLSAKLNYYYAVHANLSHGAAKEQKYLATMLEMDTDVLKKEAADTAASLVLLSKEQKQLHVQNMNAVEKHLKDEKIKESIARQTEKLSEVLKKPVIDTQSVSHAR